MEYDLLQQHCETAGKLKTITRIVSKLTDLVIQEKISIEASKEFQKILKEVEDEN